MPDRPGRPFLTTFALAAAVHGALAAWFVLTRSPGTAAAWTGFPLDDAWIHMVYGRNFARHGVPLYNDSAEAGFTSPAWMLALAVAHWCAMVVPVGAVFFAKLISVLAAAAATAAIGDIAARLSGRRAIGLLAGALCALEPVLAFAQVSGMEVSLTTATCALGARALVDERHRRAGLWLGLACWCRPECLLLTLMLMVVPFGDRSVAERTRFARAVQLGWPTLALAAAWCAYCMAVTGHPLPNTFYAKFDLSRADSWWTGAGEVLGHLSSNLLFAGTALAVLGLVRAHRAPRPWLVTMLGVYPFVFLLAIVRTRPCPLDAGQFFFFARYPAPAWPFLMLATALGADAAWQLATRVRRSSLSTGARLAVAGAVLLTVVRSPADLAAAAQRCAWNCQNMNEVQVAFGRWVAANVPVDRAVAINDAGAIRYFGGRRTLDLMGLNSREVLFAEPPFAQQFATIDALADQLQARGVDCAILFPSWFSGHVHRPRFASRFLAVHTLSSEHYTVADPRSGQTTMVAYRLLPNGNPTPR